MLIVYLVVAAAVFIVIGTADLRSQARYAAKMNGENTATIATPLGIHNVKATTSTVRRKIENANL